MQNQCNDNVSELLYVEAGSYKTNLVAKCFIEVGMNLKGKYREYNLAKVKDFLIDLNGRN